MHPPLILISCGTVPHPMSARLNLSVLYGGALARAGLLSAAWTGGDPQALAERFDGLLLSGGGDMEAALFGQTRHPKAGDPDPVRDRAELALLEAFCARQKPVLGICRGIQVINVYFGGDLIQHLNGHDGAPHPIHALSGSRVRALCGASFPANSFHHQAVGRIGNSLHVTARAADGTIEALEHEFLPVSGVQWHPERMVQGLVMDTAADHTALFTLLRPTSKGTTS
ncbi:MAG: gamma-glutamyl-gamma-aminobutyrate hydrolase family protein [Butyricicoccus sp.]